MSIEDHIREAVTEAVSPLLKKIDRLEKQLTTNNLPLLLDKKDIMKILKIKEAKASEILNHSDLPVIRVTRSPQVRSDIFLQWLDEHTDITEEDPWDLIS